MKFTKRNIANLTVIVSILVFSACSSEDKQPAEVLDESPAIKAIPLPTPKPDVCCEDPGQISMCWWQDATNDGVTCYDDKDCPNKTECVKTGLPAGSLPSPDGRGLCKCLEDSADDDCGNEGICVIPDGEKEGLCGPSFCNGYRICSCFGGCVDFDAGEFNTPADQCASLTYTPSCCDGVYPDLPGTNLTGYCSADPDCGEGGCTQDSECPDDGNPCTTEWCNTDSGGCESEYNDGPCNDDNPCTEDDTCDITTGLCEGTEMDCDDTNVCTIDSCDITDTDGDPCVHDPVVASGNACTVNDDCPDGESCPIGGGECYAGCEDGDACTYPDQCTDGFCIPGPPRDCTDGNDCTDDECDPTDFSTPCINVADDTNTCDDEDYCTENDECVGGACVGDSVDCNDDNPCTEDSCDATGGCVNDAVPNSPVIGCEYEDAFGNSDPCTTPDTCVDGDCVEGPTVDCTSANICILGECDTVNGGCIWSDNDGAACDDGDLCTENDTCSGGGCAGTQINCAETPTDNPCTVDTCDSSDGSCVNTGIPDCCTLDSDCIDECAAGGDPPCALAECDLDAEPPECVCDPAYGADNNVTCDLDTTAYPENCWEGQCVVNAAGDFGSCDPVQILVGGNSLCTEAFDTVDTSALDYDNPAYLGFFNNVDENPAPLVTTGSTECGLNNYEAVGNQCSESTGDDLGYDAKDTIYVFEYQVNSVDQFQLYSYMVKVEADFDVAVYVKTDIQKSLDCPEAGDNDPNGFHQVDSARCFYPKKSYPTVVEDECIDGNLASNSECCNSVPFAGDPLTCVGPGAGLDKGYYWCRRYYPAATDSEPACCNYTNGEDCESACEGHWEYPEDPNNCDFETSYTQNVATAVISPEGANDGSWRKAFIFIDGVSDGSPSGINTEGNFSVSVQRRPWAAGPCDRSNDDQRLFDVTNAGYTTSIYQGNLEMAVNDTHMGGGDCGGYTCSNEQWLGGTDCHETSMAYDPYLGDYADKGNEFWPNNEYVKIDRPLGTGIANYCFETNESGADMADLVLTVIEMQASADSICSGYSNEIGCAHDNTAIGSGLNNFAPGNGDIKVEFKAQDGITYIVGISNYEHRRRPCGVLTGDKCNYALSVTQGGCPPDCSTPLSTSMGNIAIDSGFGSHTETNQWVSNLDGDGYACDTGPDELWTLINNTSNAVDITVRLEPLDGAFDPALAIYDCDNGDIGCVDNEGNGVEEISTTTIGPGEWYYIVVEGEDGENWPYELEVSWGTPLPDVLVVNDGQGASEMESALTNLGFTFDEISKAVFANMTVGELTGYGAVFYAGTLDTFPNATAQDKAMEYMDAGGRFLIANNDVGYYNKTTIFYETYLQAEFYYDVGGTSLTGLGIMSGINLNISADPYPDGFDEGTFGVRIFRYQTGPGYAGGIAVDRSGYLAVYLSFNFQNIATTANEIAVINAVMGYFGL